MKRVMPFVLLLAVGVTPLWASDKPQPDVTSHVPAGDRPWLRPGATAGQEIIGPHGAPMVWVPAGSFTMGSENGRDDEKPLHDVRITKGFWVDKYEVTNELLAKFLNEHGKTVDEKGHSLIRLPDEHCGIVGPTEFKAKPGRENHPVVEVTWWGAVKFAAHHGLALPTEAPVGVCGPRQGLPQVPLG